MHKLYKIVSYFFVPLIIINTYIRVLKKKEDGNRYKERYGFTNLQKPIGKELIWIHASSVGEFKSSDFLINNFYQKYSVLVTTTTKTYRQQVRPQQQQKILIAHQVSLFGKGMTKHTNLVAVSSLLLMHLIPLLIIL